MQLQTEKFLLKIHVCTYFSFVPFSSSLAEASSIHIFFASPLSRYGLVMQEAQRAKPHTCPGAAKGSIIPSWLPPPGAALSTCLDWYSDIDCGPAGVQAQRAVWRARWAAGPPHGDEMVQQHCCSRRWWNQSKSRLYLFVVLNGCFITCCLFVIICQLFGSSDYFSFCDFFV